MVKKGGDIMNESYLVTKANTLINSHYDLSLEEQRIIITLSSLVQPSDEEFKPYKFSIKDFMKLIGVEDKSKYSVIPKITKGLMQKVFEIRQNNKIIQVAWLASCEYEKGTGTVELQYSPKLMPFMLGLKEFYTTYKLSNVLELRKKYSIRLYEILKSYEYQKSVIISLDELRAILKADTEAYSIYQNFKSRIIEPAFKELKEKTDIQFEYEEIKTGRKITAIKFLINKNRSSLENSNNQEEPKLFNSFADKIKEIQKEFKSLYKGNLKHEYIEKMLNIKGHEYIKECLGSYREYIKGRNISNIAGDFYTFVTKGYEKPVPYKGKIASYNNFEQREYKEEEYEKFYANLQVKE